MKYDESRLDEIARRLGVTRPVLEQYLQFQEAQWGVRADKPAPPTRLRERERYVAG